MRNPSIHWHEGLFLRPHHFQAAERNWAETLSTSQQWDHPYSYGLHQISFSTEALANHQLQVHVLKARLPDGTLIDLGLGQELDRLDLKGAVSEVSVSTGLKEAFESKSTVRVFIGIAKLKMGRENVTDGGATSTTRFVSSTLSVPDESEGGNEQEVQFRTLNVRLLLSTQDVSGYELLPIAQIKRAGAAEASPQLDEAYIPPLLSIDAWPGLGRDIVRAIYDVIGQKIDVLSQQIVNRGIGLASHEPGDADRILMLAQLNAAYATLGILAFAQGVHPFVAYTELCRIVGQLSIFGPDRRVLEVPQYDHDDLARIFRQIRLRIEQLINVVRDYEYEQRYFVGVGLGMQVTLEPKWFNTDWQWLIGVNKGDLTQQEVRDLLSSGQLDWKFGSSRQVEILFMQRAEGLQIVPVERPPRAIPSRPDWVYYEVVRGGHAWRDVQESQTLAMRLKDSLIVNRDRLQGERTMEVSYRGKNVPLQFAMFAVPAIR